MRGAIYARFSEGEGREKSTTIEAQIEMCRQLAQADGVAIDPRHIYIDRGISGASVKKRPAFMQMVDNIKSGLFPAYLYAKDDKRLFRNEQEAGQYTEWIFDSKIIIRLCLNDTGDPRDSLTSWLLGRHMHLHTEFERRAKAQETMEHMKQNALQGFNNGGLPPYGYQKEAIHFTDEVGNVKTKYKLVLQPKEARAIRLGFDLFQQGNGYKKIAEHLNQMGYCSKKGRPLSKGAVGYWFQNPYPYAGCYVWNVRKKGKIQAEEDWIIVEDQHQAIISMEEAKSCRQQYHQRIEDGTRYRRTTYPLSELLYCDLCGHKFQLKGSQKYNNLYYICGSNYRRHDACQNKLSLNQQRLEDSVMEEVNGKIMQQGFLESYFQMARKDLNQKAKDARGEIRRLKWEIKQLEDRMKQMLRDMAETKIPR